MIVMLYETACIIESTNISHRSTVEGVVFVQKEYVLCEADSSKSAILTGGLKAGVFLGVIGIWK
jgi:hypothetical protein